MSGEAPRHDRARMPRWVKGSATVALVLLLLLIAMLLAGHDPARHLARAGFAAMAPRGAADEDNRA
jgi:hypothetical protein